MTDNDDLDPEIVDELNLSDPVNQKRLKGHLDLMNAAWKFLNTVVVDGDLLAAWGLVHQTLRAELAQNWVNANQAQIRAHGFDESAVVDGLATDPPTHELWVHFQRVHIRSFREVLPDSNNWGIGAHTRIVGPDLEALYVHDRSQLAADGIWRVGETSGCVYPLVFQRVDDRWLLAMIGQSDLINDIS
jgi:hypothetical protein